MHEKELMVNSYGLKAEMKLCCPAGIIGEEFECSKHFMYLYARTTPSETEYDCDEATKVFKGSIVDPSWHASLREWYDHFQPNVGFEECSPSLSKRNTIYKLLSHCFVSEKDVKKKHYTKTADNDGSMSQVNKEHHPFDYNRRVKVILNGMDCETKNNFYEIGFIKCLNKWFPVIELSPLDVPSKLRSERFLTKYENKQVSYSLYLANLQKN